MGRSGKAGSCVGGRAWAVRNGESCFLQLLVRAGTCDISGYIYRGDSVFLAVLGKGSRPRTVCGQFGHNFSSRIGGHCPGSEERKRGTSAERRRPAGAGRVGSNTTADSCLTGERVLRECPIVVVMSMALMMPSLSDDSQGRNAHNSKLAEHI